MTEKFKVEFLEEVFEFLDKIDKKARNKILFNIDIAKVKTDNTLFKKLTSDIWEFRTFGLCSTKNNTDFLHFGTKQIIK